MLARRENIEYAHDPNKRELIAWVKAGDTDGSEDPPDHLGEKAENSVREFARWTTYWGTKNATGVGSN